MTTVPEPSHCPKCGSPKLIQGRFCGLEWPASFEPDEIKPIAIPILGGRSSVELGPGFACFDCGFLWTHVSPEELCRVVKKWGRKDLKTRLLAED